RLRRGALRGTQAFALAGLPPLIALSQAVLPRRLRGGVAPQADARLPCLRLGALVGLAQLLREVAPIAAEVPGVPGLDHRQADVAFAHADRRDDPAPGILLDRCHADPLARDECLQGRARLVGMGLAPLRRIDARESHAMGAGLADPAHEEG